MHVPISIIVVDWYNRTIDRKKIAIRTVVSVSGGIVVGHESPLEERIWDEGHAIHDVRGCEAYGFGLGKVIGGVLIELQLSKCNRCIQLERNDLRRSVGISWSGSWGNVPE